MNVQSIKQQLKELRMHTAFQEIDTVLQKQNSKTIHFDWVADLLSREIDARKERAVQERIKRADFPEATALETFDWQFNPSINKEAVEELATLGFVQRNEIVLLLGKPGTGKTHIATAIGVKAVYQGHRVFSTSLKKLIALITTAKAKNTLDLLFKKILSARLWILDDWGIITMQSQVAEEVFDLLDRRRRSGALILTSNRDVDEWHSCFPDPVIASAAIDRIFDRPHIITFDGDSYRLKGKRPL
jgi:DNA replication protein DnaC